jgi:hypothetical protein
MTIQSVVEQAMCQLISKPASVIGKNINLDRGNTLELSYSGNLKPFFKDKISLSF